ncbi:MAG: hypothetical protein OEV87_08895 [Phycisphaerae bacterium]|nr:hypothetical protein [Phycisphaerae bacterium]
MTSEDRLKRIFPRLHSGYFKITSEPDNYNCVAWAVQDVKKWWQPLFYWPKEVPEGYSIDNYIALYEYLGFERCDNSSLEEGYEKISLYAKNGFFKHVSRQLKDGYWTSKLGEKEDIKHSYDSLTGDMYGGIVVLMKKRI